MPAPHSPMPRLDSPSLPPRLAREYRTLSAMVWIYCHDLNGEDDGPCDECRDLIAYAGRRIDRCLSGEEDRPCGEARELTPPAGRLIARGLFGEDKPTCANCTVHCYNAVMRERVR